MDEREDLIRDEAVVKHHVRRLHQLKGTLRRRRERADVKEGGQDMRRSCDGVRPERKSGGCCAKLRGLTRVSREGSPGPVPTRKTWPSLGEATDASGSRTSDSRRCRSTETASVQVRAVGPASARARTSERSETAKTRVPISSSDVEGWLRTGSLRLQTSRHAGTTPPKGPTRCQAGYRGTQRPHHGRTRGEDVT